MDKKNLVGVSALLLTATLSGCSQVHFGRDAITIGAKKTESKKKEAVKKQSSQKKVVPKKKTASAKKTTKKVKKNKKVKKTKKVVKTNWNKAKTNKLQIAVNKWSRAAGKRYRFYDGIHLLKTKKGATYPTVFTQNNFILNKKTIKLGYSPLGKNKYQYNVVAIANADFKTWHNTYLFCLKNNKLIILLDQSKKGGSIIVKKVKDPVLNKDFEKVYQQ
ncbi:DUF4767 domain-containing protein [Lactobacillus ultunensis]|uniref:DUF4767 domain-containing protein n=1 Tax=Lactobacillus ultunensis DSM 16047 TaxID=525365 RepID=C2EMP2_9LACO|nr:DUF4767 domain-containing protein [Lactobacillus ultunensis]EEJ72251.1 hypothetical protein HMPREF0548_0938 [Lactobacillus ultunensis DSM 16047]KRL82902.1 hypothetical protein FC57_GL000660 [Lactobacillus ultunensis DSM 16047]QQP27815.1 DUF4767 domain-containing protein [Lactobacillus ultunensis]